MSKFLLVSGIVGFIASICTVLAFILPLFKSTPAAPSDTAEAHYQKAVQLRDQHNRPLAEEEARQAIMLQPTHREAHKLLAACYMTDGSVDNGSQSSSLSSAANEYTRAVEIDPDDMEAELGLAVALESLGQRSSARNHYAIVAKHHGSSQEQREIATSRLH